MRVFKLLSALIDYPSDELLGELRRAVTEAGVARVLVDELDPGQIFSVEERQVIAHFAEKLLAEASTAAQARYVQTFDLTAEHSLHLTHHIFGEEKTRGPALIDLTEYLKGYGFAHDEKELPDYLPLLLEFVSELREDEARVFLGDAGKVLKVIADNLEKSGSDYAPLIRIIDNHGSLVKLAA
ncbi:nitrate reductase molybdenum cofactor assembly chaperone [Azonexus sp.]|uniref:nitrate reductase molybdenum cofactor assembly chaperone n=1 Tax=Azonexus sp. TaxID=1872668 RepID=UPI0035B241DA